MLVRFTTVALLLVLVFPLQALAGDGVAPNAPTITVNGNTLTSTTVASSTVLTNPWSAVMTFVEDISAAPLVTDGTPSFDFTNPNSIAQTVTDCSDADSKTYCFNYIPTLITEPALAWYFRVSGATDTSGEYMATTTYRFILDTAGPTTTLDTLPNHEVLPTISGGIFDNATAIRTYIEISSASTTRTYQTTVSNYTWSYTLQSGDELPNGTYTVTASSTDQYNNRGAEVSGTFVIDTSAPVVTITSGPTNGGYASSSPVSFGFTVTDATTTTALCSWDGVAGACTSPAASALSDGSHTFGVAATDAYNNKGATTTRTFTLDTAAPALAEVAVIAASTDTTPDYSFTSTEAGALAFSGACSAATSTVGVGTTTLTFAALAVGTYGSCSISVTDVAGNVGSLSVSPFTIEAIPPPTPAPSSSGGGGGGGIIGGPMSVGYQIPYIPPLPSIALAAEGPAAPEPRPVQVTVGASTGGLAVATPTPAAPTQNRTSDVRVITVAPEPVVINTRSPVAVVTPWDIPAGKQINLAAAAAATGFQLPLWVFVVIALLLVVLGISVVLSRYPGENQTS